MRPAVSCVCSTRNASTFCPRHYSKLTALEPKTNAVSVRYSLSAEQMTKEEQELAAALRERRRVISDESSRRNPDQHMARLREISDRIESLAAALPQPVPPRLAHFLDRRSYDKALEFLCNGGP